MAEPAAPESGLRIGAFAGAPIIVDPTLLLLAAYLLGTALLSGGVSALPYAAVTLGALLLAVLLHEFGHASVAAMLGIPSKRIVLTFFGGYVQFVTPPQKRWHEIAVSAAGPLTNLACAWLADRFVTAPDFVVSASLSWPHALDEFARLSLLLGAFNLIPALPLDGGHILRSFLNYFMSRPWSSIVGASLGILLALALFAYGAMGGMWWTAMIALLLGLSAWAEIQRSRALLAAPQEPPSTISNA